MRDLQREWFENISGPMTFRQKIKEALQDDKSVALCVPRDFPWRNSFRESICDITDYYIDSEIDVAENFPWENLKEFFINECTIGRGDDYRNQDFFEYYSQRIADKKRIIWFKGIPQADQPEFFRFCVEYMRKIKGAPPLIVEINQPPANQNYSRVEVVKWTDFVGEYDSLMYAYLVAGELSNLTLPQKHYIANACMEIFGDDVELFTFIMQDKELLNKLLKAEIIEVLGVLSNEYERRGESVDHILNIFRNERQDVIYRRLWKAQLKTFFPLIEVYRGEYIDRHAKELEEQLKKKEYKHNVNGKMERINSVDEIEINQLRVIAYEAGIATNEEYHKMEVYKDVRNELAHLHYLTPERMGELWQTHVK